MGSEWTKRDAVGLLDFYVENLRILGRRFENSVLPAEMFCLPKEWFDQDHGHHSLYNFELAGIKGSGYPEIFNAPASAGYATPNSFVEFFENSLKASAEGTLLAQQWRLLSVETIALDPRYVAFRTAHDWVTLHAQILAADSAPGDDDVLDLSDRVDPLEVGMPSDRPDEPAGLIAGSPLRLADGGFRNRWDPNYSAPWHEVSDHIGAIHYFHFRGTFLLQELRGWPHHSHERHDPRLLRLELLTPHAFAEFVAPVKVDQTASTFHTWHDRAPEEVERYPRFIAHKCAFDRDMIVRMTRRPPEPARSRAEEIELIKTIGFEEFELLLGETEDDDGKPN